MAPKRTYLQEAHEYYRWQEWCQQMLAMRIPRSIVIKAGSLAALGGASALSQLLAACTLGASEQEDISRASTEGSYKWSKYPMIEKYNFRSMPWPTTPYVDGVTIDSSIPANWDFLRARLTSNGGRHMNTLFHKRYGAGADMQQDVLEGHLADKLTTAPDYSYYDYHIRPGMYFHDIPPVNGRLCTAEDAAYVLERYRTDSLFSAPLTFVERFQALDKETLRVHLKRPVLFLNHILASSDYWIFAREHAEGDQNVWKQQPIGTGPFKVVEYKPGASIVAARHERHGRRDSRWPDYPLPFLKEWRAFRFADITASKAAFRSGQLDYLTLSDYVTLNDMLATNPEAIVEVIAPSSTYPPYRWELNNQNELLRDVRVRRALNMGVDRRAMIDTLYGGMASAGHPMGYTFMGLADPLAPEDLDAWHQYDPAKARSLLAEAGLPDGFEMELMTGTSLADADVMTIQYLEAIGVRVKTVQLESAVLSGNRLNKRFKHAINGESSSGFTPVMNALDLFLPTSPRNYAQVDDPVMTNLVNELTYTLDADQVGPLVRRINERALDQCYALERVVNFTILFRQAWLHNVATAVQGYYCCFGSQQVAVAWVDDKAPAGRAGHLKA